MPDQFETPEEVLRRRELGEAKSTAHELDHYVANKVGPVVFWHIAGKTDVNFEKPRLEFIHGLEEVIRLNLCETEGITRLHLIEFVDMANVGSWENPNNVKPIYKWYCKLRKQPYYWD